MRHTLEPKIGLAQLWELADHLAQAIVNTSVVTHSILRRPVWLGWWVIDDHVRSQWWISSQSAMNRLIFILIRSYYSSILIYVLQMMMDLAREISHTNQVWLVVGDLSTDKAENQPKQPKKDNNQFDTIFSPAFLEPSLISSLAHWGGGLYMVAKLVIDFELSQLVHRKCQFGHQLRLPVEQCLFTE